MKTPLLLTTLVLCGGALLARPANAHFLWGQIASEDAGKATFQVTLAEGSGEMTTVSLDKIKTATAWSAGGTKLPLSVQGAAMAAPFIGTEQVAAAHQFYGVLDKTAQGRGVYMLEYEAKAARDVSKAGQNAKLALEFFARRDGDDVLVTLKHKGKALPNTNVKLHEPGTDSEKPRDLVTDAAGQLRFEAKTPGLYGLRAAAIENTAGEFEGKKYPMLRRYTTLTFAVAPQVLKTLAAADVKPVAKEEMGNAAADPKAYALLKAAHDARQVLPVDFGGYTATVTYRDGATTYQGTIRLESGKRLEVEFPTATGDDKDWIQDTVGNIIGHRRGGTFATGDGKNPLTLNGEPNGFGQLIELHDRFNSSYRVKNNKVTEVTREMGESRFTISVMDTREADPGKYISNHFTVAYRDKATGALQKVDAFHDDYANWNKVWVPAERIVVTIGTETTPRVRTLRFSDYKAIVPARVAQVKAP